MTSKIFQDVELWRLAHKWVLDIYRFTAEFPKQEMYGLTSQLRRAAVSVPGNFAEGFKKTGMADKLRFYNIAQGSLEESRYYLILARDLEYGDVSQLERNAEQISKMLNSYMNAVRNARKATGY